jgi:hypothetical protein
MLLLPLHLDVEALLWPAHVLLTLHKECFHLGLCACTALLPNAVLLRHSLEWPNEHQYQHTGHGSTSQRALCAGQDVTESQHVTLCCDGQDHACTLLLGLQASSRPELTTPLWRDLLHS